MFAYLKGKLAVKTPTTVVLDLSGVGYEVSIPLSTYERLPEPGSEVFLHIYPCYRPESVTLVGFAAREEKTLFQILLGVNGVGPKLALTILSGTSVVNFRNAIVSGDDKALSTISGIGKKLSQRLITELKDQILALGDVIESSGSDLERKAVGALVTLGYPRGKAMKAVQDVTASRKTPPPDVETLIKEALKSV